MEFSIKLHKKTFKKINISKAFFIKLNIQIILFDKF